MIDLQRAEFFMHQDRYKEAQGELAKAIAQEPDNAKAHSMMAFCMHRQKAKDAKLMAQRAVGLDPQSQYSLNILGHICFEARDFKCAEKALRDSLRISPYSAYALGILALTLGALSRWQECLQCAEAGLEIDPDDTNCHNARVKALAILGRKADAQRAVYDAMSENSEEPLAQTGVGWAQLRMGRHKEAIEHFREALRLDPNMEYAREGMVEALRARFPVYRLLIAFRTWLIRMPNGLRSTVTIGLYVMARVMIEYGNPVLFTIGAIYVSFVIFSWLGGPILNMTLLAHPLGRIALSRNEKKEAIALASLFVATGAAFAIGGFLHLKLAMLGGMLGAVAILITCLLSLLESVKFKTTLVCVSAYLGVLAAVFWVLVGLFGG